MRLLALQGRPAVSAGERVRLADEVRSRLDGWRALLRRQPEEGRVVLDALLTRRIRWTPLLDEVCYEFKGWAALDGLITGCTRAMVTPAGFEPAISTLKGSRPGPG
jgi:hypothetical protein